jgi:solute carrier family 25 oxoglutarate transporter 11
MAAPPSPSPPSFAKAAQPYVCGGASAVFASICVQPMDLTKTRMQLLPKGVGLLSVASQIVAKEGFLGLYAGLSASIMRQAVYGTARLGLHREFSDRLKAGRGGGDLSALGSAGSAMAAGAIASVIGTPFDVALVRMQADGMKPAAERRGYTGVFNALGRIVREEGAPRLWSGFEPTAARAIAMNVGMMASFDQAKQAIRKVRRRQRRRWRRRRARARARTPLRPPHPPTHPSPPPPAQRRQPEHHADGLRHRRHQRLPDVAAL